jgi:hypothetical protein
MESRIANQIGAILQAMEVRKNTLVACPDGKE